MTNNAHIDTSVRISSILGRRGSEEDEARACQAASDVLCRYNMDANTAFKLFCDARYRFSHGDFPPYTQVWLEAEKAANDAYNEHWPKLDRAHVVIKPINHSDLNAEKP